MAEKTLKKKVSIFYLFLLYFCFYIITDKFLKPFDITDQRV
ncbi:hypothetical protein HMPREF9554_00753 [Treponema phagedenis F0421]|nr:hypothetical protein HMPREF9554_00753 [Treponema phagedenis F0421]